MKAINPATGNLITEYEEHSAHQVQQIIDQNQQAFLSWRDVPFSERSTLMFKAGEVLRDNAEKYAGLMTLEMGKTITESRAEVKKSAWVCDYYAENAEDFLADEPVKTDAGKSFIAYQPIGPVLAVMPWNFPFWQVFRFAAPALMAGNAGLLKHASNVPGFFTDFPSG